MYLWVVVIWAWTWNICNCTHVHVITYLSENRCVVTLRTATHHVPRERKRTDLDFTFINPLLHQRQLWNQLPQQTYFTDLIISPYKKNTPIHHIVWSLSSSTFAATWINCHCWHLWCTSPFWSAPSLSSQICTANEKPVCYLAPPNAIPWLTRPCK